jgi:hypothetical protein
VTDEAPPLLASDADREAAAERLRIGMGDGRLTVEELEQRLTAAYQARTRAELDLLVADLPSGPAPAPQSAGSPVPVRPGGGGTGWVVSVMGRTRRTGRWRLARRCQVVNVMGRTVLDLAEAELAADRVAVNVFSVMGKTRITVPESLTVEVSRVGLMAHHDIDLGAASTAPSGPVLRVRLISIMGRDTLVRAGARSGRTGRRRRLDPGEPEP